MSAWPYGFAPDWIAPASVRAWITERGPGVDRYGALNLADHVGDDRDRVAANRARLRTALQLPSNPVWLEQVHGSRVLDLDEEAVAAADGAVTGSAGVVCAVLTADCLPVLLCDRAGRRVGVAHAGWRGLAAGVLGSAVRAMRTEPRELLAWLGPAIGQEAYEVGADVYEPFVARDPRAAARFRPNRRGRWQADLYGLARDALERAGVQRVFGGGFCTFTQQDRFYSHRRLAPCGRMASLIWLETAIDRHAGP